MHNKKLVSVCMITYNHEKYIKDAIEGVLMQKTNFPIELIIGEDCSNDYTRNIVKEYETNYPEIIYAQYPSTNRGMIINFFTVLQSAKGKYIALCEGDDYWTDPYKLQKQVDFLEHNPEYSMCAHNAIVDFEDDESRTHFFNTANQKSIITTEDLIEKWSFATASMLFLASLKPNMPNDISSRIYNGDLFLALMVSLHGPIKYIPHVMSVYRRSKYATMNKSFRKPGKDYNRNYIIDKRIELLNIFDSLTKGNYTNQIEGRIKQLRKSRKRAELYYRFPIIKYLRPKKIFEFLMRSLFKS